MKDVDRYTTQEMSMLISDIVIVLYNINNKLLLIFIADIDHSTIGEKCAVT